MEPRIQAVLIGVAGTVLMVGFLFAFWLFVQRWIFGPAGALEAVA